MSSAGIDLREARRGPAYFLVGTLLTVTVFVAIGPLVGCLAYLLMTAILGVGVVQAPLAVAFFLGGLWFVTIPVAYLMGWPAAAASGGIVAFASIWLRAPLPLYLLGFAAGAATGVLLSAWRWNQLDGMTAVLVYAITGGVAALVCTRLARPFRLAPREIAA